MFPRILPPCYSSKLYSPHSLVQAWSAQQWIRNSFSAPSLTAVSTFSSFLLGDTWWLARRAAVLSRRFRVSARKNARKNTRKKTRHQTQDKNNIKLQETVIPRAPETWPIVIVNLGFQLIRGQLSDWHISFDFIFVYFPSNNYTAMASYRFVILVFKHDNETIAKSNVYQQDSLIRPKWDF